ncbi:hypothetical protein L2E82_23057 [Cichorium intybus]|uniref:Uncharacterized protein n=1 Tax=Cichorium intybus TaxID=13427 RepID=A0ACB9DZW0_CICIN|nr:hypothetical protein L2E82_23057 [Cichorium intybus]
MAIDAANNSPPSRSYFHKSVSLQDWWLTKPQTVDDRKRIGVSGLTCTSQLSRAERCFSSAPILKAYDFFELETVDGICVILQGYINKEKTLQSGFSSEVFDHFVIGFPPYWEEFSTNCSKTGSSDDYISRANEDGKDSIDNFDDTCTMDTKVEDCKAKEPTMKAGDEVISEIEDAEGNDSLLKKNSKMDSRRTTRSMTKMDSSKKGLEKVSFVDKEDASKQEQNEQCGIEDERKKSTCDHSQIDTHVKAEIIHRLTRSMKVRWLKVLHLLQPQKQQMRNLQQTCCLQSVSVANGLDPEEFFCHPWNSGATKQSFMMQDWIDKLLESGMCYMHPKMLLKIARHLRRK